MAALSACALDIDKLPIVRRKFNQPPLNQITEAILPELSVAFETVNVEVVQCPDLTQPPFYLAAEGLSGNETAIHVGSLWNLFPLAKLEKLYDMKDIKQLTGSDPLFVVGAGAGPWPYAAGEWVGNMCMTSENGINNRSHVYKINTENGSIVHKNLPPDETRFAHMANLYTSNGLKGEVLKIVCETRKSSLDFVTTVREALKKSFGDKTVCLGGVILIENGKVKVHVYPHYSKTPINSEVDLKNWIKFYEVHTPLVGLGYIASHDPGLDMMPIQHFHLFSNHGPGGHYLHDTEPTTIKYTAYLNVAKNFIRIDPPDTPFSFRKD